MRKRIAVLFILITVIGLIPFSLTGCWGFDFGGSNTDGGNNTGNSKSIDLTLSNYEYYLSIDEELTSSGSALQGSFRYASYKVTVTGAVNGLYQGCSLYYKVGDTAEKEVKLNASGYATFNYSWSTNSGNFSFTRATGKIIL